MIRRETSSSVIETKDSENDLFVETFLSSLLYDSLRIECSTRLYLSGTS